MSEAPDPRRESILEAAYKAFALYGYRRTSMEAIASGTGLSRASLYLQFSNKEEIFRALAERLHAAALDDAESALVGDGPLADRLEEALVARVGQILDIVAESPHGEELVDESSRLCGDIVLEASERFQRMLSKAIAAAARGGELNLSASGLTAPAAAELLRLSANGIKQGVGNTREYRKRTRGLVRIFVAGFVGRGD